jgi:agmatine deiminase
MNYTHVNSSYRKPAEFAAHAQSWMIWPHRNDLYGGRLAEVQREFVDVVRAIAQFEPVTVVAHPDHQAMARKRLKDLATVTALPVDDFWMRDCGPSFLLGNDGSLAGVSWVFNAWGEKHTPWDQDDALAQRVTTEAKGRSLESWLCCEGGSFALDGEGTLIITETSILNPNRNPGVNKALAEAELKAMLGVEKVIWLPGDPMDIETDGHIDGLCAFVKPGTLLFSSNPDPFDPHSRILTENLNCLRKETDARGRSFEILPLEEAVEAHAESESEIFCSSYINFYLVNGGVIVPGYGTASDEKAAQAIAAAFPERRTVQVQVSAIAAGGGAIHCITQEQPAPITKHA